MKKILSLATAAGLSIAMLGMGLGGSVPQAAAAAPAASSGTLIESTGTLWSGNFIPELSGSVSDISIWYNQFLMLLGPTPNFSISTYGGVVSKYTVSKDRRTFTFWLNPKARWSNGRRVSARDVQLFLQWMASKAYNVTLAGPFAGGFNDIVGMTEKNGQPLPNGQTPSGYRQLSRYKFSITTTAAYSNALINEVGRIVPLPYFALHKYPFQDWNKIAFDHFPTVSDGPWVMSKIIPNEVVVQTANKYFEYGPPRIPTVETKYVPDQVLPGDLIKGYVNFSYISARYYSTLKRIPTLKIAVDPGRGYDDISWKLNNTEYGSVFRNVHFRRGVLYALDRPAMVKAFLHGLAQVETGPLPDMYSWYDPAANEGKYAYAYNPDKAIQEFRRAGLVQNKKTGWFELKDGKPFDPTFTYASGSQSGADEAQAIASYMHAAHVDLKLNPPEDFNTMLSVLSSDTNGTKPIQGFALGDLLCADPSYYSSMATPEGCATSLCSYSKTTLPAFQKKSIPLLTEQKSAKAFNHAYRKKVIDQWQVLFSSCVPWDVLWDPDNLTAYASNLHGVVVNAIGWYYPWRWYFGK